MHELPVAESILEMVQRHAQEADATRVTDLYLVIGKLSSIVDDSIQFYWDIISEGTLAEGAQLHFERIPAELFCLDCGSRYVMADTTFACPSCQGTHVKVVAGDEFRLEAIDVETREDQAKVEGEAAV
jgi:hydrogenase nickel incorporation protein HypA/HybF